MGVLADLLTGTTETPQPSIPVQDGRALTTVIEGAHDASDYEAILRACDHDPSRVRFGAPPSVYVRWKADGTRVSTYRYKLEPVTEDFSSALVERCRQELLNGWVTPQKQGLTLPFTYVMLIADPQLGKVGTQKAVANYKRGVLAHIQVAKDLIALGRSPEAVHVAWMGDEGEGVCNNYTNQSHIIELNQTQQLELDFELRVWALKEIAKLGLRMSASSVISNHGEWTRNGTKDPVTSRNDNASTFVARQAKRLFDEAEEFGGPHIEWTIGDDDPGVVVELSGERCYFSHGYIEKGRGTSTELKTKNAIEKQILGDIGLASIRLWFMAHYHHFYSLEFEGRTLFGCPALEATEGSKEYMKDQFGVWSPPGMLGMLVGAGFSERGWSSANVF
ncbi:hypothetical protein ACH47B_13255 [Rhodococcus sp. NPDC019627]|uniref:hypothetical protein n=1 Tax=unclassified Rhodococcus (in: high G+C Gram-positive bacteria) TaxID=192944 RepID=UPI0033DFF169